MIESDLAIIFPYEYGQLIQPDELKSKCPLIWDYFEMCRSVLDQRENGAFSGPTWYQYSRTQALDVISQQKIFTPDIAPQPSMSLDKDGDIFFTGGTAGGYGIIPSKTTNISFLLGLLNSSVLEYVLEKTSTALRGGWFSYEAKYIRNLPIPLLDTDQQQVIANVVLRCLDAAKIAPEKLPALEAELNALVYEAYGLDADDIAVIEAHLAGKSAGGNGEESGDEE